MSAGNDPPTRLIPGGTGGAAGRHARSRPSAAETARAWVRRLRRQAPLTAVLLVAAVAFWRIGLQHWREGTTLLGTALLLGAALRAALTDRAAGLLAVRPTRAVDVAGYAVFGLLVILVTLTIAGGPLASR